MIKIRRILFLIMILLICSSGKLTAQPSKLILSKIKYAEHLIINHRYHEAIYKLNDIINNREYGNNSILKAISYFALGTAYDRLKLLKKTLDCYTVAYLELCLLRKKRPRIFSEYQQRTNSRLIIAYYKIEYERLLQKTPTTKKIITKQTKKKTYSNKKSQRSIFCERSIKSNRIPLFLLPGAEQFYRGQKNKGIVLGSIALTSFVLALRSKNDADDAYNDYKKAIDPDKIVKLWSKVKGYDDRKIMYSWIVAGVSIYSLLDLYLLNRNGINKNIKQKASNLINLQTTEERPLQVSLNWRWK